MSREPSAAGGAAPPGRPPAPRRAALAEPSRAETHPLAGPGPARLRGAGCPHLLVEMPLMAGLRARRGSSLSSPVGSRAGVSRRHPRPHIYRESGLRLRDSWENPTFDKSAEGVGPARVGLIGNPITIVQRSLPQHRRDRSRGGGVEVPLRSLTKAAPPPARRITLPLPSPLF